MCDSRHGALPPGPEGAALGAAPQELAPGIAVDAPVVPGWRPLATCAVLIVVGLSGAGKSSALRALAGTGAALRMLPDRRLLTERLIIAPQRRREGLADQDLSRRDRYPYVRQFLRLRPGGMAEILARLAVDTALARCLFIFDNLRGAHEIASAATLLPRACFALLDAPAHVRVERLLARDDPHDHLARLPASEATVGPVTFASLGVPNARALFDAEQERDLCARVAGDPARAAALRSALEILAEEHSLYPATPMRAALAALPPSRVATIDTTTSSPAEAARACLALFATESSLLVGR